MKRFNNKYNIIILSLIILTIIFSGCAQDDQLEDVTVNIQVEHVDEEGEEIGEKFVKDSEGEYYGSDVKESDYQVGDDITLSVDEDKAEAYDYEFLHWELEDEEELESEIEITLLEEYVSLKAGFAEIEDEDPNDENDDPDVVEKYNISLEGVMDSDEQPIGGDLHISYREPGEEEWHDFSGESIELPEGTEIELDVSGADEDYAFAGFVDQIGEEVEAEFILEDDIEITAIYVRETKVRVDVSGGTSEAREELEGEVTLYYYDEEGYQEEVIEEFPAELEDVLAGQPFVAVAGDNEMVDFADYGVSHWLVDGKRIQEEETDEGIGLKAEIGRDSEIEVVLGRVISKESYNPEEEKIWEAVRESDLNKPYGPITDTDLADINHLNATGYDVSALYKSEKTETDQAAGEYFVNLSQLIIPGARGIEDDAETERLLEEISKMESLRTLDLSGLIVIDDDPAETPPEDRLQPSEEEQKIIDALSKFDSLDKLEVLWLNFNELSHINFIENLTGLEKLYFTGNYLLDLTPLAHLLENEQSSLERVNLRDNEYLREGSPPLPADDDLASIIKVNHEDVISQFDGVNWILDEWPGVNYDSGDADVSGFAGYSMEGNKFFPGGLLRVTPHVQTLYEDAGPEETYLESMTVAGYSLDLEKLINHGALVTDGSVENAESVEYGDDWPEDYEYDPSPGSVIVERMDGFNVNVETDTVPEEQ